MCAVLCFKVLHILRGKHSFLRSIDQQFNAFSVLYQAGMRDKEKDRLGKNNKKKTQGMEEWKKRGWDKREKECRSKEL
jgi:hypothetical protein